MSTQLGSDEKICPCCAETIKAAALLCRYCRSPLTSQGHEAGELVVRDGSPPPPAADQVQVEIVRHWWGDMDELNLLLRITNNSAWVCSYYLELYVVDSHDVRVGMTNAFASNLQPGRTEETESSIFPTSADVQGFEWTVTTHVE